MKKVISLILVLTMLFSFGTMVFAAEQDEKPIKINFVIDDEVKKTIYVDYGEDYNSQAPNVKKSISNGIKYEFAGWECDNKYYKGAIYTNLPVIQETVPVYELTFKATYSETEFDGEEIITDIIGDDMMSSLKTIWDEFLVFLKTIILYLATFITVG